MARCRNTYALPIDFRKVTHWHRKGSCDHVGKLRHSLDFYAPEGTPIKAAFEGVVVWLKKDSKVGGISRKYYYMGNRIVLKHKNGEYSAYEHMKYGGVLVEPGQHVKKGQPIGYVGSTGRVAAPHLHFEVFNKPDKYLSEGETLLVSFGIPRIGKCKH
jgi:murein DD-endopeptidase MepM/ murein hydrolase activator NlpD